MKVFETQRMLLVEASLDDSSFFMELMNSPNWIQFIGDRGIRTDKDAEKYIEDSLINSYIENGFGLYIMCLKDSGMPIGICGFVKRTYLDHPDIGFAILPKYEGKGYAYEAAMATVSFGKSRLKLKNILAVTTEENRKSRNLLVKMGLVEIGKIRPDNGKKEFLLFSD
jgi:RimJ/RimL family protein N-acetyltransferase